MLNQLVSCALTTDFDRDQVMCVVPRKDVRKDFEQFNTKFEHIQEQLGILNLSTMYKIGGNSDWNFLGLLKVLS